MFLNFVNARSFRAVSLGFCALLLSGCASMFSGTKSTITVDAGGYNDAEIYLSRTGNPNALELIGVGSGSFVLPKTQLDKATIVVKKPGCSDGMVVIAGQIDPMTGLNLLGNSSDIGFLVDLGTGAVRKPVQTHYSVRPICQVPYMPQPYYPQPYPMPAGAAYPAQPYPVQPYPTQPYPVPAGASAYPPVQAYPAPAQAPMPAGSAPHSPMASYPPVQAAAPAASAAPVVPVASVAPIANGDGNDVANGGAVVVEVSRPEWVSPSDDSVGSDADKADGKSKKKGRKKRGKKDEA